MSNISRIKNLSLTLKIKGFSYIEILATVAILALLATAAVPYFDLIQKRQKESELRHNLRLIRDAIDAYKKASDEGRIINAVGDSGYPKRLEDLTSGIGDDNDTAHRKLFFLRRLPRDPMAISNTSGDVSAAQTWRLRSYDSPPNQPQEGSDVFDVYSSSDQKGLDGVPYSQW
ncbi:MAG: type II secretion system protein [Methylotenera sp.]